MPPDAEEYALERAERAAFALRARHVHDRTRRSPEPPRRRAACPDADARRLAAAGDGTDTAFRGRARRRLRRCRSRARRCFSTRSRTAASCARSSGVSRHHVLPHVKRVAVEPRTADEKRERPGAPGQPGRLEIDEEHVTDAVHVRVDRGAREERKRLPRLHGVQAAVSQPERPVPMTRPHSGDRPPRTDRPAIRARRRRGPLPAFAARRSVAALDAASLVVNRRELRRARPRADARDARPARAAHAPRREPAAELRHRHASAGLSRRSRMAQRDRLGERTRLADRPDTGQDSRGRTRSRQSARACPPAARRACRTAAR